MTQRRKKDADREKKPAAGRIKKPKRRAGGRPFKPGNKDGVKFKPGHDIKSPGRPPLPPGYHEAFELMEPEAWGAIRDIVNDPAHKDREKAAEYVTNRRRGKPTERTEVSGPGGAPLIPRAEQGPLEALRRLVAPSVDPKAPAPPAPAEGSEPKA